MPEPLLDDTCTDIDPLIRFIAAAPPNVTTLDLSWSGLGYRTGTQLTQMLQAIPTSITSLYSKLSQVIYPCWLFCKTHKHHVSMESRL